MASEDLRPISMIVVDEKSLEEAGTDQRISGCIDGCYSGCHCDDACMD